VKIILKRILVPTDFSEEARSAMAYGITLAEEFNSSLHLLHVVDEIPGVDPFLSFSSMTAIEAQVEARAWDELGRLLPQPERDRLKAVLALEWGTPDVEIIRYAEDREIDLIVMSARGRGTHPLTGSVATGVVQGAPCPVLTLRHPEREFVIAETRGSDAHETHESR
jgi:nucleotide-binding universal stress UspA family protein